MLSGETTHRIRRAVLATAAGFALCSAPSHAQTAFPATVTAVVNGETVLAQLSDGRELTVRLIGIDTPAADAGECGAEDARAALEALVLGQPVALQGDSLQPGEDGSGRSLLYVDRFDGLDVGLEMVRQGWSRVDSFNGPFARRAAYRDAEAEAEEGRAGVWGDCDGDFHHNRADELRERGDSATAFVRRYYRRLSARRYRAAWGMLGSAQKRRFDRSFRTWRAGYGGSLGISVLAAKARLSGDRAVVTVRLRSRDRDVCSRRNVPQYFRGDAIAAPRGGTWVIVKFRIRKTGGRTPRRFRSECPRPKPAPVPSPPSQGPDCQGYDPCLTPGPDYDCAGGSGDGPRYVEGPVSVRGSDPYGLDSDGNGVGCES